MSKTFNDPLFSAQWYLVNTGQRGGTSKLDINVLSAWDRYTGKGVIVSVNDDGMDLTHPSLVANLLTNLAYDSAQGTTGQGFVGAGNSHGTVVGSIVGMAGNDGIGGVGVAYESKIVPGLAIGQGVDAAKLFLANLAAGASVSVNSWGADPAFAENFGASGSQTDKDWGAALTRAATEARGGLGMVIEVSGGNERGNKADTALSNFTGNKLTIAVGALTETGAPTDYSTPGASLLVSAPGGVSTGAQSLNSGFGIASADVQGTAGYNTTAGTEGDYAYQNQGTSYSGPMVGGAAALMLQANPNLGFRDVSNILAMTAVKVDVDNASWVQTKGANWNIGGMHFSRDFGFGLMDVSAAVRLAESWPVAAGTMANWVSAQGTSSADAGVVPDSSHSYRAATVSVTDAVRIERMEFDLNLTALTPSQVRATITSPSGTTITLFDEPLTRTLKDGAPDMSTAESPWPDTFTIGSTAFLGESSVGTWTLKLTDKISGGEQVTYNSLTVRAWGSAVTNDTHRVFTDEFSGNSVFIDTAGIDTMNAAAASAAVVLNLNLDTNSKVGQGAFSVSGGSVIENAIGGLGNDTLTGNAVNNILRGNGGNDTLDGGAGIDTAVLTGTRASYTLGVGTSTTVVDKSGLEGTDTLTNMERLQFSDTKVAIDLTSGGNAAKTAQFMGLLGYSFLSQKAVVGNVLGVFDQTGMDLSAAFTLVLGNGLVNDLAGGTSDAALVQLIYRNLVGSEVDIVSATALANQLLKDSGGAYSRLELLNLGGTLEANLQHVGLVGTTGLLATGLEYV